MQQPQLRHHQPLLPILGDCDDKQGDDEDGEPKSVEDSQIEEIFKEVDDLRNALRDDAATDISTLQCFRVGSRASTSKVASGGPSAMEVFGIASTQAAKEFCSRKRVKQSASFTISVYGQADGSVLARGWCHKMQWAYNLCQVHDEAYVPTAADFSRYQEPRELTALFNATTTSSIKDRTMKIRSLFKP